MFTTSDILTQQLFEKRGFNHDARRTLRISIMGTIIGPIQRTWFLTLEHFIPPTSKVQVVKKLIVDQTIYGHFIIFFFYTLSGTLAGKDFQEIKLLLRDRYVKTTKSGRLCRLSTSLWFLFSTGLILFIWCPCVGICTCLGCQTNL